MKDQIFLFVDDIVVPTGFALANSIGEENILTSRGCLHSFRHDESNFFFFFFCIFLEYHKTNWGENA